VQYRIRYKSGRRRQTLFQTRTRDRALAGLLTKSKQILQDHCRTIATPRTELKDLIQTVLHHPEFERLVKAIDNEVNLNHDIWEEGDGRNDCRVFKRPLRKDLLVLLEDQRWRDRSTFNSRQSTIQRETKFLAATSIVH